MVNYESKAHMNHGKIVGGLLAPPNQDSAKSVHPTMRTLDYPASRFSACLAHEILGLFAARTNMGCEAEFFHYGAHLIVIITLVHAHPLWFSGSRFWPLHRNTLQR